MSNSNLVMLHVPAHKSNYTIGRSGRKIERIAIHHMAGVLSAKVCGGIFQRAGRNASAHYGIGPDGEIAQYVDEANTAWTNSNWDSNCKSVTIETANSELGGSWPVSDAALAALIKLVADIAQRHGIKLVKGQTVVWHSMYAATTCPGPYLLGKIDYIIAEANKLIAGGTPAAPEGIYTVVRGDTLTKIAKAHGVALVDLIKANTHLDNINLIYPGTRLNIPGAAPAPTVTYLANSKYTGVSIADALRQIGADPSFAYRAQLAAVNGIRNYAGTAAQNRQLLALLKAGQLIKA